MELNCLHIRGFRSTTRNCSACGGSKLDVDVDVGVNWGITQQLASARPAGLSRRERRDAGSTIAIGFSLAWTPKGLKKF